jgi:putative ABC transport system permease protein
MFRNYFKVAVRNILKHKFYSFINILGLTIGIASCLLITLYIVDELSFDRFHKDAENVYRLTLHGRIAGQDINTLTTSPPLGPAMVAQIPGVESFTRVQTIGELIVRFDDESFIEKDFINADSNFFEFFSFGLIKGEASTVLREPNSIVLTESIAKKYFANNDPVGQTILIGNTKVAFKVTGVAANPPGNSHIRFAAVRSASNEPQFKNEIWLNNFMLTYVRKNPGTPVHVVNEQVEAITAEKVSPQLEQFIGMTYEKMKEQGGIYSYALFPMLDAHLRSGNLRDGQVTTGDIKNVYIFGVIGIFILLIACINFMNLSTARSAGRAKEVGMRKTMGSERGALVNQFLAESVFYSFLATVFALLLAYFILPFFNTLSGKELGYSIVFEPLSLLFIVILILFVGIIAGSYPAFYLTSFNAVEVLKGKISAGVKSGLLRSTLVVLQFSLSIALIICTSVVYKQINFMRDSNMGFDKHNVIVVQNTNRLQTNQEALKTELEKQTNILASSFTANNFPGVNNTTVFRAAGTQLEHVMGTYYTDWEHIDVMKFELAEGRFFSRDYPADSTACVINEAAMRELGWSDYVNEEIVNLNTETPYNMKVIGVVKDFNFESMRDNIRPLVIQLTSTANNMMVRYQGNAKDAVSTLESTWKGIAPDEPLQYTFLDENFDNLFKAEQRMGDLFTVFTLLAILVACLGLFGLAAFTAEQRTKEIGVRKVMGASVFSLTALLSKEFTRLVLIAFVLAVFPSWYVMDKWLNGFAYHTIMGWEVFALAGMAALVVAWITVSFQSFKAALANPVDSLKYE